MTKLWHEIRDPIHVFVRLDSSERRVLDSRVYQRLRHITQLALTYLIYPGATHKRFEHCLGVMELAGRVFDTITSEQNVNSDVRDLVPEIASIDERNYWRRVLRMAALCHDIGHLPFSHAAEDELLPSGWSHERLSRLLIESDVMASIWKDMRPPLNPEHIVKVAIGARSAKDLNFTKWERILSEIIVGDAFGVDRIDYLLRDSHHTGVAYGKFDHYKLVDEIRILPSHEGSTEPALGIDEGGIYSSEALMLARYFMFSQVYYHPIRLIYDRHLKDFLVDWLAQGTLFQGGTFPIDVEGHLCTTDNEVNVGLAQSARNPKAPGHDAAKRIVERKHFRVLYERNPSDKMLHSNPSEAIADAAVKQFGASAVRYSKPRIKEVAAEFPVRTRDGRIVAAVTVSNVMAKLKPEAVDYVFIDGNLLKDAEGWLERDRQKILEAAASQEKEGEKQ
jgi:HD superfamily phosphohydrolase